MGHASRPQRWIAAILLIAAALAWLALRPGTRPDRAAPTAAISASDLPRPPLIAGSAAAGHPPAPVPRHTISGAVRRLGPKAFLLEGSTVPPEGKAVDIIRALQGPAENGDGHAALMIALKLMSCQSAIEEQDNDESLFIWAQVLGGVDEVLRRRAQALALCEGLDADTLSRPGEWLQRAADAGNINAQVYYASAAHLVLGTQTDMLRAPERTLDYKARALQYLQLAARQGSVDALYELGSAYWRGILVERDDGRAYAYFLAGARAGDQVKSWDMEQLEASIPVEQRHQAATLEKKIYRDCCKAD